MKVFKGAIVFLCFCGLFPLWYLRVPKHKRHFHVGFISYNQKNLRKIQITGLRSWIDGAAGHRVTFHVVCDNESEVIWRRAFLHLEPEYAACVDVVVNYVRFMPLIESLRVLMVRSNPPSASWTIEMLALAIFPLYVNDSSVRFLFMAGVDEIMVQPLAFLDPLFLELEQRRAAVMLPQDLMVNMPNSGLTLWNVHLVQRLPWIRMLIDATLRHGGEDEQYGKLTYLMRGKFMALMDMSMFYSLKKVAPSLVLEVPAPYHVMSCPTNLSLYDHVRYDQVFVLHCCAFTEGKVEMLGKANAPGPWKGLVERMHRMSKPQNLCLERVSSSE